MRLATEREAVTASCKRLLDEKLVVGTAGNVSVRSGDLIAISPSGVDYRQMMAEHVVVVDLNGTVVEGELKPSSEMPLHLGIYSESTHVAIVHTHAVASTALSTVVDEVPTSHYYSALFGGPIRVAPYAPFGSPELAANVTAAMRGRSGALMSNHGAVVAAASLDRALDQLAYLEYICDVQLRAMATGAPVKALSQAEIDHVVDLLAGYGQKLR